MLEPRETEIERKFWVSQPPANYRKWPSRTIRQGYISIDPNGTEVRIRVENGIHTLTVKSGQQLARTELSFILTHKFFHSLWLLTSTRRLTKTRYLLETDSSTVELDVFKGDLEGLYLAEIEFQSTKSAKAYRPLPWMTKEITGIPLFYGRNLWKYKSFSEVEELLLTKA